MECVGGFTTLCDGVPRCRKAVSKISTIWTYGQSYSTATLPTDAPPFLKPTPRCTLNLNECEELQEAWGSSYLASITQPYCNQWAGWGRLQDVCDTCSVVANEVQLLYWPVEVKNQGVCSNNTGTTITGTPSIAGQPNTVIWGNGTTLTSPSVYLSFKEVWAQGTSWYPNGNGQGLCGSTARNVLVPVDPGAITSYGGAEGGLGGWVMTGTDGEMIEHPVSSVSTGPVNYAHMNYHTLNNSFSYPLVPVEAYQGMSECWIWTTDTASFQKSCSTIYPHSYRPYIGLAGVQAALHKVDPHWGKCTFATLAFYDPPLAVSSQSELVAPTTTPVSTNQPGPTPEPAHSSSQPTKTQEDPQGTPAPANATPTVSNNSPIPQSDTEPAADQDSTKSVASGTPLETIPAVPLSSEPEDPKATPSKSADGSVAVITDSSGQSLTVSQLPKSTEQDLGTKEDHETAEGASFTVVGQDTTISVGGGAATVSGVEISAASGGIAARPARTTELSNAGSGNTGHVNEGTSQTGSGEAGLVNTRPGPQNSAAVVAEDAHTSNVASPYLGDSTPTSAPAEPESPDTSVVGSGAPDRSSRTADSGGSGSTSVDPTADGGKDDGGWSTVSLTPASPSQTATKAAIITLPKQSSPITADQVSSGVFVISNTGSSPPITLSVGGSATQVGDVTLSAGSSGVIVGGSDGEPGRTVDASTISSDPPARPTAAIITLPDQSSPITATQVSSGLFVIAASGTSSAITLSAGGSATKVNGAVLSAASGGVVVGGGQDSSAATAGASPISDDTLSQVTEAVLTLPGHSTPMTASEISSGVYVIPASGSDLAATVSVGGKATTINNVVVSAGSSGLVVQDSSGLPVTTIMASAAVLATAAIFTPSGQAPVTAVEQSTGVFVVPGPDGGSVTLSAGGSQATVDGTVVSAASSGLVVGGKTISASTIVLPTTVTETETRDVGGYINSGLGGGSGSPTDSPPSGFTTTVNPFKGGAAHIRVERWRFCWLGIIVSVIYLFI